MKTGSPEERALKHIPTYSTFLSRKKDFSLANNSPANEKPLQLTPMRSHHNPEFSFSSNELSLKTAPPNFLLSSVKRTLLTFLLQTCL